MSAEPTSSAPTARIHVVSRSGRLDRHVRERLIQAGYEVSAGRTEAEALRRVQEGKVDALICQVQRPDRRVLSLLEQLAFQERDTCVILVGSDDGAEQAARFLRSGAFDYLTLPLKPEQLVDSVRQGLDIRRAFMEVRTLSERLTRVNRELAHERDSLQQWNHKLAMLNRLSQRIAGSLDADEIGQALSTGLQPLVDFETAGLVWLKPERIWVHTPSAKDAVSCEETRRRLLVRANRSARSGDLAETGTVRQRITQSVSAQDCAIEHPLVVRNTVRGLLYVERRNGRVFDAFESQVVTSVATSLTLALHNVDSYREAQDLARQDSLTNLLNRRALNDVLVRELKASRRYRSPACLIMVDLDYFKIVNDRLGHPVGDDVLKAVGRLLSRMVRDVDVVARYGGEEFAIVLPHTELEPALIIADRIREQIERHPFDIGNACVRLTVSMGVARVPAALMPTADAWVAAADAALYEAKAQGRNRVAAGAATADSMEETVAALTTTDGRILCGRH